MLLLTLRQQLLLLCLLIFVVYLLNTQVSEYALFFYDILYLYAKSVRAALDQGTDPRNGTNMFQIANQQRFMGKTRSAPYSRKLGTGRPFSFHVENDVSVQIQYSMYKPLNHASNYRNPHICLRVCEQNISH